jgi:hypothetical protein
MNFPEALLSPVARVIHDSEGLPIKDCFQNLKTNIAIPVWYTLEGLLSKKSVFSRQSVFGSLETKLFRSSL